MSEDEQVDLVTLTWLGRGDGGLDDWDDLRAQATRVHNRRTASYLLGTPLVWTLSRRRFNRRRSAHLFSFVSFFVRSESPFLRPDRTSLAAGARRNCQGWPSHQPCDKLRVAR